MNLPSRNNNEANKNGETCSFDHSKAQETVMEVNSDFECGAAKRLIQLGDNHWRMEAPGDASGQSRYFCVRVRNRATASLIVLQLDVYPDADLDAEGVQFFLSHFPSKIWYCTGDWKRWVPLRNTWEGSVSFHHSSIELHVPVEPGGELYIASNPPLPYSDLLAWTRTIGAEHAGAVEIGSLGMSTEGRDIPLLRLHGARKGLPKFLVLAGQHPSEHGGSWACKGIVEYVLSHIAEACEITENFDLAVIPMTNPDGNVHGLNGANAEGVDLTTDYVHVAAGTLPKARENQLLWKWLCDYFPPDVFLHFHSYMGWKTFCDYPYEGGVLFVKDAERLYTDPQRIAAHRAIRDRLVFDTYAYTAHWDRGLLGEEYIEYQLAERFGTLSALYHINSGSQGAFEQFRRGPEVLKAMTRALARDVKIFG